MDPDPGGQKLPTKIEPLIPLFLFFSHIFPIFGRQNPGFVSGSGFTSIQESRIRYTGKKLDMLN